MLDAMPIAFLAISSAVISGTSMRALAAAFKFHNIFISIPFNKTEKTLDTTMLDFKSHLP